MVWRLVSGHRIARLLLKGNSISFWTPQMVQRPKQMCLWEIGVMATTLPLTKHWARLILSRQAASRTRLGLKRWTLKKQSTQLLMDRIVSLYICSLILFWQFASWYLAKEAAAKTSPWMVEWSLRNLKLELQRRISNPSGGSQDW